MTEVELERLEAGYGLDCLVHDLIWAYRGPETQVAPYSTKALAMGAVLEYLAEKCRYFGLMHSYDGLWVAVAADDISELAAFDMSADDLEDTIRSMATTPMLAVCRLAVAIGYQVLTPETGISAAAAETTCFGWKGGGSFAGGTGGV